jgi:hypothetical protein
MTKAGVTTDRSLRTVARWSMDPYPRRRSTRRDREDATPSANGTQTQDEVIRNLEVIGEALRRTPARLRSRWFDE